METRYQRIAREQTERQAASAVARDKQFRAEQAAARKQRRVAREARAEHKYSNALASDHDHSMDA